MATTRSFALQNWCNRASAVCSRKDNPTREWILYPNTVADSPAATPGLHVLYASNNLHAIAVLDCNLVMPEVIWGTPATGEKMRPYHLMTPEFYIWCRGGLVRLEARVEAERTSLEASPPSVSKKNRDEIAPNRDAKLLSLRDQLQTGLERWAVIEAWAERFMDSVSLDRAASAARPEAYTPRLYQARPNQADFDAMAWVMIADWAKGG